MQSKAGKAVKGVRTIQPVKTRLPLPGHKVRGSQTGRPIMALLDLLGRRGTLRILWELREKPLTFRALLDASEGNPAQLNTRIKELRGAGLVEHGEFGYHLSRQGSSLLEVLGPLQAWSKGWETALERARGSAESRGSRSG